MSQIPTNSRTKPTVYGKVGQVTNISTSTIKRKPGKSEKWPMIVESTLVEARVFLKLPKSLNCSYFKYLPYKVFSQMKMQLQQLFFYNMLYVIALQKLFKMIQCQIWVSNSYSCKLDVFFNVCQIVITICQKHTGTVNIAYGKFWLTTGKFLLGLPFLCYSKIFGFLLAHMGGRRGCKGATCPPLVFQEQFELLSF
jgi:hypothetical protein